MEYVEVSPLPKACQDCYEPDCYECDYAGERWVLPKKQELLLQKKMKEQAIRRFQRQIEEIDKQLAILQYRSSADKNRILLGYAERMMHMYFEETLSRWHCPNCGELVQGVRNEDGVAKGTCRKCGSCMVRKYMGRRHDRVEIYAPKGQERIPAY